MKAIDNALTIIDQVGDTAPDSLSREVDILQDTLKRVRAHLESAQDEWIVYFHLEDTQMSAKVQAVNSADACETVGDMFLGREMDYVNAARTHDRSGPSCS